MLPPKFEPDLKLWLEKLWLEKLIPELELEPALEAVVALSVPTPPVPRIAGKRA